MSGLPMASGQNWLPPATFSRQCRLVPFEIRWNMFQCLCCLLAYSFSFGSVQAGKGAGPEDSWVCRGYGAVSCAVEHCGDII